LVSPASTNSNNTTKRHSKAIKISIRSSSNLSQHSLSLTSQEPQSRTPPFHFILQFMLTNSNKQTHIKHTKVTLTELAASEVWQMVVGILNKWQLQRFSMDPLRNTGTQKGVPAEQVELISVSLFLSINHSCYTTSH
jgi:hypothetical protein